MTVEMGQSVLAYFFLFQIDSLGVKKEVLRSKGIIRYAESEMESVGESDVIFRRVKHRQKMKEARAALEEYLDV